MTFITYLKKCALSRGLSQEDLFKIIEGECEVNEELKMLYETDTSQYFESVARNIVKYAICERDYGKEDSRTVAGKWFVFFMLHEAYPSFAERGIQLVDFSLNEYLGYLGYIEACMDAFSREVKQAEESPITIEPEYSKINELDQFLETISM